jgi:arylsulfatase A
MTGRYGFHTGWYNFRSRAGKPHDLFPFYSLGEEEISFADVLRDAGYTTIIAGKWQLGGDLPNFVYDNGFDKYRIWAYKHNLPEGVKHTGGWQVKNEVPSRYWHPCIMQNGEYMPTNPNDYGPDLFTDYIIDFIIQHRDKPFFVYYPMVLTHKPWDPTPSIENPGMKTEGGLKNNVEYMDHLIGKITRSLEEMGLRENTLIIFTGDNGTGETGKGIAAEIGARVPLIVSCPGIVDSGIISDELVDLTDILPTLAEFANASLPADRPIDGVSLVPTLTGKDVTHREWIFSYLHECRILRTKHWLMEGDGRFFYCGNSRDGSDYEDMTDSDDPKAIEARKRFKKILEDLPKPENLKEDPVLERRIKEYRRSQ